MSIFSCSIRSLALRLAAKRIASDTEIEPGDRVVVFVLHKPLDPPNRLVFASDGLFIEHGGHVIAPLTYLTSSSADRNVTLERVQELAERACEK